MIQIDNYDSQFFRYAKGWFVTSDNVIEDLRQICAWRWMMNVTDIADSTILEVLLIVLNKANLLQELSRTRNILTIVMGDPYGKPFVGMPQRSVYERTIDIILDIFRHSRASEVSITTPDPKTGLQLTENAKQQIATSGA